MHFRIGVLKAFTRKGLTTTCGLDRVSNRRVHVSRVALGVRSHGGAVSVLGGIRSPAAGGQRHS